jgi:predicted component of type VI protein secretion system
MLHLLKAFTSELQLAVRGLLRLLDERVQDNHSLSDQMAVERSTNAGATTRPKLKQAIAEGARVWQSKTWPVFG